MEADKSHTLRRLIHQESSVALSWTSIFVIQQLNSSLVARKEAIGRWNTAAVLTSSAAVAVDLIFALPIYRSMSEVAVYMGA